MIVKIKTAINIALVFAGKNDGGHFSLGKSTYAFSLLDPLSQSVPETEFGRLPLLYCKTCP